jgi:hypothetical protein
MRMRPAGTFGAAHIHAAADPVVLDGVGQQVHQHLLEACAVGANVSQAPARRGKSPDAALCACGSIMDWQSASNSASATGSGDSDRLARLDQRQVQDLR